MMKVSRMFIVGTATALLPLAAAVAQSQSQGTTPDPAAPPAQSTPSEQRGGATFESLDKDSDGRISKAEAESNANVKAQFSRYDVNGDGFIERSEVTASNTAPAQTPQQ